MKQDLREKTYTFTKDQLIREFTSLVAAVWANNGWSLSKAQDKYDKWLIENNYIDERDTDDKFYV